MATSTAAAAPRTDAPSGELSHRQILTILSGLMLGMFLAALDQTVVSTAIRTIGDDLDGLSVQAWVTTAFLITSTITTPLYGKLSDIYGRKPLFLIAISIFILGSALCGLSTSMYMLAGFRAFQGLGAGGLFSLALAIVGDIIPPRERARYQGYFMAVFATSSVLGPLIGGFLAGQNSILGISGWRWIFYVNVPIGVLALVVVSRVLHLSHVSRPRRLDWMGSTALVVGLVPLLIVAEQGRTWGWGSFGSLVCFVIGAIGIVGFVVIERHMGDDALLPLRLFHNRVFSVGAAQSFVVGIGMFGGITSIPLYLQIVKGASPTKAGLLTLPLVAGIMTASLISGQLTSRTGRYKIFPIIGSVLLVAALGLMSTVGADTPLWQTDLYMAAFGAGLGLNMQTIVLAMQNSASPSDIGVSTSSATFFRQVGGTMGAAVFLSILFSTAGGKIASAFQAAGRTPAFRQAAAANPGQLDTLRSHLGGSGGLNDTSFLSRIDRVLAHPFLVGFSDAMDLVFMVGAIVLVAAVVLSLFLKEVPLRTQSGQVAARAGQPAAGASSAAAAGVPSGAAVGASTAAEADGHTRAAAVGGPGVAPGTEVGAAAGDSARSR